MYEDPSLFTDPKAESYCEICGCWVRPGEQICDDCKDDYAREEYEN